MRDQILALAALALATPAAAQDGSEASSERTVEGAQRFLSEYYSSFQNQIQVLDTAWDVNGNWKMGAEPPSFAGHTFIEAELARLSSTERCKMIAEVAEPRAYSAWALERGRPLSNAPRILNGIVDFSQTTTITVEPQTKMLKVPLGQKVQRGWRVSIRSKDRGAGELVFVHQDEESAKRAAFAMNFLREQCGFKSDTGF